MRSDYLFTSESVSEGHPDKVSDQISDAIVDLMLAKDPEARVACETMTTTQRVILSGEIRCAPMYDENNEEWAVNGGWAPGAKEEIEQAVRGTVRDIGYEQDGFHWKTLTFENHLHGQSAHIAQGVDAGVEGSNKDEGAGDQGIMFGFACDETPDLMPATLDYSHKILHQMAEDRHSGKAPFLEPDAKSQVTLRYKNGKPVACTAVVVSTQHAEGYDKGDKETELKDYVKGVVAAILPDGFLSDETQWHINPTGSFVIGGPDGDAGLTGRKIIVDTYGGASPHGGGAFSGKDPLSGKERGRRRPCHALHDPDRLCDRRQRAALALCRYPRHRCRRCGRRRYRKGDPGHRKARRPDPARHPHAFGPQQADLSHQRGLRPLRAHRRRRPVPVGAHRSGR